MRSCATQTQHHAMNVLVTRTRCHQVLSGGWITTGTPLKYGFVIKRSFWKLNKQTLSAPPPPEEPTQPQPSQSSQPQPAQPQEQKQTENTQTKSQNKNKKSKAQAPQPPVAQVTTQQAPAQQAPTVTKQPLHPSPDGIVFVHQQQWFFRLFGAGVIAQFGAWVFFADVVGHHPQITYNLSFPVFGAIIGVIFSYFARELSTHNVQELKVFPGGRAIEIVTYTLLGSRRIEVIKPKKQFSFDEWRANPFPLKFAVRGDKMQYFINFNGELRDPKMLEYCINAGDIKKKI